MQVQKVSHAKFLSICHHCMMHLQILTDFSKISLHFMLTDAVNFTIAPKL